MTIWVEDGVLGYPLQRYGELWSLKEQIAVYVLLCINRYGRRWKLAREICTKSISIVTIGQSHMIPVDYV